MTSAVAFLCKEPHKNLVSFAQRLNNCLEFDIFLIIDSNEKKYSFQGLHCFQISDEDCFPYINASAYKGITSLEKNPNAWDKMFYCFLKNKDYDFVWVFEEDVFIPRGRNIQTLHDLYSQHDLVTPNNFKKTDNIKDWHWSYLLDKYDPPFYYSMVCAFGMSKKMMDALRAFVQKHQTLYYHEVMLNTIAMQNGLSVMDAFELKSVVWQGKWGIDEFLLLPNNVFHPLKNVEIHELYRKQIRLFKGMYSPQNNLPDFLKRKRLI